MSSPIGAADPYELLERARRASESQDRHQDGLANKKLYASPEEAALARLPVAPSIALSPEAIRHLSRPPGANGTAPAHPIGHGNCAAPRPVAYPGTAARVAEAGISLTDSLQNAAMTSTRELGQFIDEYTEYTSQRPNLKALHEEAVASAPQIMADRRGRDALEHAEALRHQHMDDQTRLLEVRAPLSVQQQAGVGEVVIPIGRTVDTLAQLLVPGGQAFSLIEAATGRDMGGLGFEISNGRRVLDAAIALAPAAGRLLSGGAREAMEIVSLARATGRTESEVRSMLRVSVELEKERPLLVRTFQKLNAGEKLSAEESAAVVRARMLCEQGGVAHVPGMASPLHASARVLSPSELKPLTSAEEATIRSFLNDVGTPPQFVDRTVAGFASGVRTEVLSADLHVYRYYGAGAGARGRWVTEYPTGHAVRDLALDAKQNPASDVAEWVIPKGTKVLRGPVAPLNGQPGGASQIYVPDPAVLRKP